MIYRNIKLITLSIFLFSSSPYVFASHPCAKMGTGVQSCAEVSKYRELKSKNTGLPNISLKYYIEKAKDKTIDQEAIKLLNEKLCIGVKPIAGVSIDVFQKDILKILEAIYVGLTPEQKVEDLKLGFLMMTHQNYLTVEKKRRLDLKELEEELKAKKITSISAADVQTTVNEFRSHVDSAMVIMNKSAPDIVSDPKNIENSYLIWFQKFVGGAMVKNFAKVGPQLKLKSFKSDKERFIFLNARANTTDNGKEYSDGITPYMARMVLTFYLGKKMNEAQRDEYANRMELKYNITKTGNDANRAIHQKTWAATIFHDGYIYGAPNKSGINILHTISTTPEDTCGIDCSLYVQRNLVDIGFTSKELGGRMTTAAMLENNYQGKFDKILLCSETQLLPGDILVKNGHTQIFRGYTKQKPVEFLLYEATGEENRNVRLNQFELYTEGSDCQQSRFTTDPNKPYYALRLKKVP